jgi:hypothetical protein
MSRAELLAEAEACAQRAGERRLYSMRAAAMARAMDALVISNEAGKACASELAELPEDKRASVLTKIEQLFNLRARAFEQASAKALGEAEQLEAFSARFAELAGPEAP